MATMYHLFLGILFTAVCSAVSVKNYFVETEVLYGPATEAHSDNLCVRTKFDWCRSSDTCTEKDKYSEHTIRTRIVQIATAEIGVREATEKNDGKRVEEYLQYTGLAKGHEWCAAFVSWCYGQAGLPEPRNPWSPALFPKAKTYWTIRTKDERIKNKDMLPFSHLAVRGIADIFGIYGQKARRINHVGLIKGFDGRYLITIEGNSNNRVESKRRHLSTVYAIADWL